MSDAAVKLESMETSAISPVRGLALCVPLKGACKQGQSRHSLYLEKKIAFHRQREINRHLPGHCSGCGNPWTGETKQCDKCHARMKRIRAARRIKNFAINLFPLERRIASLEIAVARLQLAGQKAYKRGYDKGYRKGNNHRAGNYEALRGEFSDHRKDCITSKEELANVTHRYTFNRK